MKKISLYIVFCVTCFYFIFSGNISFFSKLSKDAVTAVYDLDEDAAEKETKDNKEDTCDEDNIVFTEHVKVAAQEQYRANLYFCENCFARPQHIAEKTCPPPKA